MKEESNGINCGDDEYGDGDDNDDDLCVSDDGVFMCFRRWGDNDRDDGQMEMTKFVSGKYFLVQFCSGIKNDVILSVLTNSLLSHETENTN